MDPLSIALLAAGGGSALAGLFKGWGQDPYEQMGSPEDMVMINRPQVEAFLNQLAQQQATGQRRADQYTGKSAGALDSIMALSGNYANLQKSLEGLIPQYGQLQQGVGGTLGQLNQIAGNQDPSKALNLFLGKMPELKDVVSALTASATGGTSDALKESAAAMGAQARSDISGQLAASGLLSSGAGVKALAEGIATPTLQANVEMQKQYGNTYQNLANLLMGGGLESLNQGVSVADQNAIAALQGALQAQSLQGNMLGGQISGIQGLGSLIGQQQQGYGQVASGYGNLASQQQALLSQILGIQGQYNEPVYWQPSYAANPDYLGSSNLLGMGTSLLGAGIGMNQQSSLLKALQGLQQPAAAAAPASMAGGGQMDLLASILAGGWGGNAGGSVSGNSRQYGFGF